MISIEEYKRILEKNAPILCCRNCRKWKCPGKDKCKEIVAYIKRKLEDFE